MESGPIDALIAAFARLPGIGRKTAHLLMATAFGRPGLIVDTHCSRLSNRLGFSSQEDPVKIEFDLRGLVPEADWTDWSHAMVFHGRYCCAARKPDCPRCPLTDLCPYSARLKEGGVHRPAGRTGPARPRARRQTRGPGAKSRS